MSNLRQASSGDVDGKSSVTIVVGELCSTAPLPLLPPPLRLPLRLLLLIVVAAVGETLSSAAAGDSHFAAVFADAATA